MCATDAERLELALGRMIREYAALRARLRGLRHVEALYEAGSPFNLVYTSPTDFMALARASEHGSRFRPSSGVPDGALDDVGAVHERRVRLRHDQSMPAPEGGYG